MRNILILVLTLMSISLTAQNMKLVELDNGTSELQNVSLDMGDTTYMCTLTSKGSYKLARPDYKSGWQWIGYKTKETYTKNGTVYTVFKNTKDVYFYYVKNDKGWPSKRSLSVAE